MGGGGGSPGGDRHRPIGRKGLDRYTGMMTAADHSRALLTSLGLGVEVRIAAACHSRALLTGLGLGMDARAVAPCHSCALLNCMDLGVEAGAKVVCHCGRSLLVWNWGWRRRLWWRVISAFSLDWSGGTTETKI